MFRVKKEKCGWIVEQQIFKYSFFGLHFWKVWRPFVKSSGLDSAWHAISKEWAIKHLNQEIESKLIIQN